VEDDTFESDEPKAATTMAQLVRAAAAAYGDDVAVVLHGQTIPDDSATFIELDQRSGELARGLLNHGVGKGTRVGFIQGNSPAFAVLLAAISRIGAVAVPISTLIKAEELIRVLRRSDVAGLIVQRSLLGHDYVERLIDALPELGKDGPPDLRIPRTPFLRWIASSGPELPDRFLDLDDIIAGGSQVSDELLREVESEVHATDQMIEIYTSGSMALPKGVKHDHGPVMFRTNYMRSMLGMGRGTQVPASMPMFWVGGLMMFLMPGWASGATVVCAESTSTNSLFAMGSVMPAESLALMPVKGTKWGLGMSETLGPYSYGDELRAPGFPLCTPMDHAADRMEIRVADEHGNPVADGERGEIQVRGYALTPGLHKIEREGYFEPDGFYRTGDIGLVEGTRIHFVGRAGDMIKTNGSNVSPAEVEMELQELDGVLSAYVFGLPDERRGEIVVAAVVPRDGVDLDLPDLQAQLRSRISSFKVPRELIAIAQDEVPMLHSNKVGRRLLQALIAERLGRDAGTDVLTGAAIATLPEGR
jgi:acyl-CoA synthetase (AMP-forming)/AMP-acid ligase II